MDQSGTTRRLAAILAADVVGYSRLIGADEVGTLAALRVILDEIVKPLLNAHNGRLVKLMGDGVLAEFASVIDAVTCAVAIQTAMVAREKPNPEDARIRFRIGINLGDIIIEDEDIFGDGVILAARLEGLADPGGICVSRTVADHVGVKAGVAFAPMGMQQVKNIADPVEAYRVVKAGAAPVIKPRVNRRLVAVIMATLIVAAGGIWWMLQPDFTPADPAKMTAPLPAGPSIAVLPFSYFGPDKEANDYISDGLSENIISTLARIPGTLVIARNSTFTYKDKPVDVREVAEKFGVRYVLEGSIQMSGDSMRVTAQLVDGVDGRHIWTEIYDRTTASDIFAVQDEITLNVAKAIYRKTISGSDLRRSGGTTNLEAWAAWVAGAQELIKALPEPILRSVSHFERAIELDPNFAAPYASLAHTHFFKVRYFLSKDPAASLETAVELAQKALILDPEEPTAHSALGMALLMQRQPQKAAQSVLDGARIAPGSALANASAAWVLTYVGRSDEALPYFNRAKRMYVVPVWWLYGSESQARSDLGDFEGELEIMNKLIARPPPGTEAFWYASAAQAQLALGNKAEAQIAIAKAFEVDPNLSIRKLSLWDVPYVDPSIPEKRHVRLRQLGVPDSPQTGD